MNDPIFATRLLRRYGSPGAIGFPLLVAAVLCSGMWVLTGRPALALGTMIQALNL